MQRVIASQGGVTSIIPPVNAAAGADRTARVAPVAPVADKAATPLASGEQAEAVAALVIRQCDDGRFVYELRETGTGHLLRQFPAEALLELARLVESGILLDTQA